MKTYYEFVSTLKRELINIKKPDDKPDILEVLFGSDQEHALLRAFNAVFPECVISLCVGHLKEDLKRHLRDKEGIPQTEREDIARVVMRLRYAKSEDDFNEKRLTVADNILTDYPGITDYLENFIDNIWKYVVKPSLDDEDGVLHRDYRTNRNEVCSKFIILIF